MFWIGMAAGAFVCLVSIIIGISAIGWSVGKERTEAVKDRDRLWQQWQEANRINQDKADIMTGILTELKCIARK